MNKINSVDTEIYIVSDFNINLFLNDSHILEKKNILNSKSIPSDIQSYHKIWQWVLHEKLLRGIKKFVNGFCMRNCLEVLENLSMGTA